MTDTPPTTLPRAEPPPPANSEGIISLLLRRHEGDPGASPTKVLTPSAATEGGYGLMMDRLLTKAGAHPAYSSAQGYGDLVSGLLNENVSPADLRPRDLHAAAEMIASTLTSGHEDAQAIGFSLYHRFDGQERMDEALDSIDPSIRGMIPTGEPPSRPWWMKALQGTTDVLSVGWNHGSAPAIVTSAAIARGDWKAAKDLAMSWDLHSASVEIADRDDDGYVDVYEALGFDAAEGKLETGVAVAAEIAFDPLTYLTFGAGPAARAALGATGRGLRAAGKNADEISAVAASLSRGAGFGDEVTSRSVISSLMDDAVRPNVDLVGQRPGIATAGAPANWRAAVKDVPEQWRGMFDEAVDAADVRGLEGAAADMVRYRSAQSVSRSLRALDRARVGPKLFGANVPWSSKLTPSGVTPGRTFSPQFEKLMGGPKSVVRSVLTAPRVFTPRAQIISSMGPGVADDFRHLLRPARSDAQLLREVGESPGGRIHDHVTGLFMSRSANLRDPATGHALTGITFRGADGELAGLLGYNEVTEAALAPVREAWAYADSVAGQADYAARANAALALEFNSFGRVWGDQLTGVGLVGDRGRALSAETAQRLSRHGGNGWQSMVKSNMARRLDLPEGVTYYAHPEIASELHRSVLSVGAQTNIQNTSNLVTRAYGGLRYLNNVASANALSLLRGLGFPFNNLMGAMGNNTLAGVSTRQMALSTPQAARLVWHHERSLSARKKWNVLHNWVDESWERLPDGVREVDSPTGRALLGGVDDVDKLLAENGVSSLRALVDEQAEAGVITGQRARGLRRSLKANGADSKQWAPDGDEAYLRHLRDKGISEDEISELAWMQAYGVVSGGRSKDILDEFVQRETRGTKPDISLARKLSERDKVRAWREAAEGVDRAKSPAQRAKLRQRWEKIDADVRARGLGHRLDEELRSTIAPDLAQSRPEIERQLGKARASYQRLVQTADQFGLSEDSVMAARSEVEGLERLVDAVSRPLESHADPLVAKVEFLRTESHVTASRAKRASEIADLQRKIARGRSYRDRLREAAEPPREAPEGDAAAAAPAMPKPEVPDPEPVLAELTSARSKLDELAAPETEMRRRIEGAVEARRAQVDDLSRESTERLLTDRQVEYLAGRQQSGNARRSVARNQVNRYYRGPEAHYSRDITKLKGQLRRVLQATSSRPGEQDRVLQSIRQQLADRGAEYNARAQSVRVWTDESFGEGTATLTVREGDERILRVSEVSEGGPRGVAQRAVRLAEYYEKRLKDFDADPVLYLQERIKILTGRQTKITDARAAREGEDLRRVIDNEVLPELQADEEYWAFHQWNTNRQHNDLKARAMGFRLPDDIRADVERLAGDALDEAQGTGRALPEVQRFEIERTLGRIGVLEGQYRDAIEAGVAEQRRTRATQVTAKAGADAAAAAREQAAEELVTVNARVSQLSGRLEAIHTVDAQTPTKLGALPRGLTSEDVQTAVDEAAWAKTRWMDADRIVGVNNTGRKSTLPQKVQDSTVDVMNLGTQRAAYGMENYLRSMTYLSGRRMGLDPRGAADLSIGTNFDYDDITPAEYAFKSVASRFYTYPRKLMGFMGQQIANEPARVLSRTHAMVEAAKYITYLSSDDDEMEIMLPDWIESRPGFFHAGDKVVRIRFPMSEYAEPLLGALSLANLMRKEDVFAYDDIPRADATVEAGGWLTSNFFGFIPGAAQFLIESSINRDLYTGQSLDQEAGHEYANRAAGVLLPGFSSGARQGVRVYETWTGESPNARDEGMARLMSTIVGAWQRSQTEIDRSGLSGVMSDVEEVLEDLLDEGVAIHTVSELEDLNVVQGGQKLRRALAVGDENFPSGAPRRWAQPMTAFDLRELAPWSVSAAMNWQPVSRFVDEGDGAEAFSWGIANQVRAEQGLADDETWGKIKAELAVRTSAEAEAARVSATPQPRALPATPQQELDAEVEAQRAALERVTERAGRMGVTVGELQDMVGWLPPVKVAVASMRAGGWSDEDIRAALLNQFAPDLRPLFLEGYPTQMQVKSGLTAEQVEKHVNEYYQAEMVLEEFGMSGPLADYWARYAATPAYLRSALGFPKLPSTPDVLDLTSDWSDAYDAVQWSATLEGVNQ